MIKGSIQEEYITLVNIYAPNMEAPKYIKQILTDIKGEIDKNTIIVGNFNTPLTSMDKKKKQWGSSGLKIYNTPVEINRYL